MGCFVVAAFVLRSMSLSLSAIAELLVYLSCSMYITYFAKLYDHKVMNFATYCTYPNNGNLNVKVVKL